MNINRTETAQPYDSAKPHGSLSLVARFVYRYALFLAIPIVLLLFGSDRWQVTGLLGALFLLSIRWIAVGRPLPMTRINTLLLILLGMVAITLRISPVPDMAVPAAAKIIAGVLVFFLVFDKVNSVSDTWQMTAALVVLGLFLAYFTPATVGWMNDKIFNWGLFYDRNWFRLSEDINPNKMAGSIVPIVPLAIALVISPKRRLRILGAIALPPLLVILVLLQSRSALFALGAGLFIFICLAIPKITPVLLALLIVGAVGVLSFPTLVPRTLLALDSPASAPLSIEYRIDLWRRALPLLVESPLVGTGLAAFPYYADLRFPPTLGEVRFSHVHNLFFQVALDTGLPGGIAFLGIMGVSIFSLWRLYRTRIEPRLVIGLMTALLVLVLNGMFEMIMWATKPGVILWMLLALALASAKLLGQNTTSPIKVESYGA